VLTDTALSDVRAQGAEGVIAALQRENRALQQTVEEQGRKMGVLQREVGALKETVDEKGREIGALQKRRRECKCGWRGRSKSVSVSMCLDKETKMCA
jgi:predicted RNase H-like nuclease (RuvC/YqgF family)